MNFLCACAYCRMCVCEHIEEVTRANAMWWESKIKAGRKSIIAKDDDQPSECVQTYAIYFIWVSKIVLNVSIFHI